MQEYPLRPERSAVIPGGIVVHVKPTRAELRCHWITLACQLALQDLGDEVGKFWDGNGLEVSNALVERLWPIFKWQVMGSSIGATIGGVIATYAIPIPGLGTTLGMFEGAKLGWAMVGAVLLVMGLPDVVRLVSAVGHIMGVAASSLETGIKRAWESNGQPGEVRLAAETIKFGLAVTISAVVAIIYLLAMKKGTGYVINQLKQYPSLAALLTAVYIPDPALGSDFRMLGLTYEEGVAISAATLGDLIWCGRACSAQRAAAVDAVERLFGKGRMPHSQPVFLAPFNSARGADHPVSGLITVKPEEAQALERLFDFQPAGPGEVALRLKADGGPKGSEETTQMSRPQAAFLQSVSKYAGQLEGHRLRPVGNGEFLVLNPGTGLPYCGEIDRLFVSELTKDGLSAPPGWIRNLPFYVDDDARMREALNAWFRLFVKNPIGRDSQSQHGSSIRNWVQEMDSAMRQTGLDAGRANAQTDTPEFPEGRDVWLAFGGKIFPMSWKQLQDFCRARCIYFPWPIPD